MPQSYFCKLSEKMSADCCRLCKKRMARDTETLALELGRYFKHHERPRIYVAVALGISPTILNEWAAGQKFPHRSNLIKIMKVITDEEMGGHPGDCPLAKALNE